MKRDWIEILCDPTKREDKWLTKYFKALMKAEKKWLKAYYKAVKSNKK